jgi:hypothetical protein
MKITSHVASIHSKQAAKITAIMALVAVLAATWPLAGAAWAFSVDLPRRHFMILLFVPFFYALATYFLVETGCAPAAGTLVEIYLNNRGINVISSTIRSSNLKHPSGATLRRWCAR